MVQDPRDAATIGFQSGISLQHETSHNTSVDPVGGTKATHDANAADPPHKKPSKFGQVIGSILGGAMNVFAPGAGTLIGNLIRGGGTDFGSMEEMLQRSAQMQMQMLMVQERVQSQTQEFTAISNLLKARHDAEMAAVNNFKA